MYSRGSNEAITIVTDSDGCSILNTGDVEDEVPTVFVLSLENYRRGGGAGLLFQNEGHKDFTYKNPMYDTQKRYPFPLKLKKTEVKPMIRLYYNVIINSIINTCNNK